MTTSAPNAELRSEAASAAFFKDIGYSTVWEDERAIAEGLRPRKGDRVLTITSGGCFALQLLAFDVAEVVALDFNPHQNALLELKKAALRALDHVSLWQFLGHKISDRRLELWEAVAKALPDDARRYWAARQDVLGRGAALHGKQDRYLHIVGRLLRFVQGEGRVRGLFACDTVAEQEQYFADVWSTFLWRRLCDIVFSRFVLNFAFDPKHFEYSLEERPAERLREVSEHVLSRVPVRDNFYLYYLFYGTYPSAENCPTWLRASLHAELAGRVGRIRSVTDQLERFIFAQEDASFDAFNLSNAFDWVSEECFDRLMREVVRVARPGARLCYWTNVVNTKRVIRAERFPEIREDGELSERISTLNRTPGYSGCVVARVVRPGAGAGAGAGPGAGARAGAGDGS